MIVILASRHDDAARRLATRWEGSGGCLVTCQDLSARGWRYHTTQPWNSTGVLGGREVALREVSAVLTLLPSISSAELLDIVPADRAYVAAEMTAFLVSWLSQVSCPILNRPAPGCLTGPYLHPEQCAAAAAKLGMQIQPAIQRLGRCPAATDGARRGEEAPVTVTVVGDRGFGAADDPLLQQAALLARTLRIGLLGVRFAGRETGATFLGATSCPSLVDPDVADAVLAYLLAQDRRPS
jgi:hypothetical protein